MDLQKSKKLYTAKEAIQWVERRLTKWKNSFSSYTSNKGLIFRIYEELKRQGVLKACKKPVWNLNREISKKGKVAKMYLEKCLSSLAIRKMKIKIRFRFHITRGRKSKISKASKNKC